MTRLVVSVRDAAEAQAAVLAGADVVDVKEPRRGSLGAADVQTLGQIVVAVSEACPISVALGELVDANSQEASAVSPAGLITAARVPAAVKWAKYGLAHCGGEVDWSQRWRRAVAALPAGVQPVPAIYADRQQSGGPSAHQVVQLAVASGCPLVLVDTFDKRAGSLLSHWPLDAIAAFCGRVRQSGLQVALAGSLSARQIPFLLALNPEYLAVRTAVCAQGRGGRLDPARTAQLVRMIRDESARRTSRLPQKPHEVFP